MHLGGAERPDAATLAAQQAKAWAMQRAHVMEHSGFYRALWDEQAPPERLEDLPALPLSDKAKLRLSQAAHPPFGDYLAAPLTQAIRLHRTSGTTG